MPRFHWTAGPRPPNSDINIYSCLFVQSEEEASFAKELRDKNDLIKNLGLGWTVTRLTRQKLADIRARDATDAEITTLKATHAAELCGTRRSLP